MLNNSESIYRSGVDTHNRMKENDSNSRDKEKYLEMYVDDEGGLREDEEDTGLEIEIS